MSGSLEARLTALEQLIIIIIVGGGRIPIHFPPPRGDNFATDQTRIDALYRIYGGGLPPWADPGPGDPTRFEALLRRPHGDPFSPDLTRLSAVQLEGAVHTVNAELVRLKALEAQMKERLKEVQSNAAG